jgi:hypothetical protein
VDRALRAQSPKELKRRPLLEVGAVGDAQLVKRCLLLAGSAHDVPFP